MKNILFVNPFFLKNSVLEQEWMMPYFPLGLLYLAASARADGHNVAVFDGTFAPDEHAFRQAFDHAQPEVVCIASLITLRPVALRLADYALQRGSQVIFGGPDPSAEPTAYLSTAAVQGQQAVVVVGEGEHTLRELLVQPDLTQVKGIAYLQAGELHTTAAREPIWDLETLPLPARDLLDVQPYLAAWKNTHGYSSLTLAATRGCPYNCDYCQQSAVGPHFRKRSPQHVAQEMLAIEAAYAPDRFRLVDDLDGIGHDWLLELGLTMQNLGLQTPYEGLKPFAGDDLPMYAAGKMLCGKRNRYLPTLNDHPHAPPALDVMTLQERWGLGILPHDA